MFPIYSLLYYSKKEMNYQRKLCQYFYKLKKSVTRVDTIFCSLPSRPGRKNDQVEIANSHEYCINSYATLKYLKVKSLLEALC